MERFSIALVIIAIGLPLFGQEQSTSLSYHEKRIQQLEEENQKLEKEIAELETQIQGLSDGTIISYADLAKKALEIEADLKGKSAVLERMKKTFVEKLPFQKGQKLESFTTTKGVALKDPTVTDLGADGVVLSHSTGIARLRGSDFPAGLYAGLILRPVSDDISQISTTTISQRPASMLKSATFAKTRSEMARMRSAQIQSQAALTPKTTPAGNSVGSIQKERLTRDAERSQKLSESIAQNKIIESELSVLYGKIEALHAELFQLELGFMKDTMAYDSMRIGRSRSARIEEEERRVKILDQYEIQRAKLNTSISDLEKQVLVLMSQHNGGLDEGRSHLSADERKKKISEIRDTVRKMESELSSMNTELNKTEGDRIQTLDTYDNAAIKSDRKTFESKIQSYNSEIVRLYNAIYSHEKKIRDLQNSIPSI